MSAAALAAPRALSVKDIEDALITIDDRFYTYALSALLVVVGLYFTVRTRGVQVRRFGTMMRTITGSRSGAEGGISSFQAFAVGLAARVGIGNVAGVALAVVAGGPGALFWMWVVAVIGMATAFAESTLAQLFKERGRDFTFQGGPAYYIKNGLGSRTWGAVFAGMCIVSVGVTVVMVQTNSLADVISATVPEVSPWMVGVALVLLTAPIVLGGLKSVARVTEVMAPLMALAYVLVALVILLLNLGRLTSYALIGTLMGALSQLGSTLAHTHTMQLILAVLANLLLLFTGLYLANILAWAAKIEHIGRPIWQRLNPLLNKLLPIQSLPACFGAGMLWGWLPCGLVYNASLYALGSSSALWGGLYLLAFGLGTLPNLIAAGLFATQLRRLLQKKWLRLGAGLLVSIWAFIQLMRIIAQF